ncbi:MAG: carbon-nitrogen hydrolase family protein [Spirochaetaceae bacterium]|nr:carbon-nitrogen hydrolase family protein [Spirochaetaceae bacterium]
MSAEITVSLVSFRFCADPATNLDRHGAWLETLSRSADSKPDFVLFPEFSLTGWTYDPDAALDLDSPLVARAVGLASEFATAVGFGLVERRGGVRYNSFVVAGPDGFAGLMRKINLTPAECRHFTPSSELPVIEVSAGRLAGLRMGVAICADATRFEMIHLLSLRGAEVILAPHANSLASYGGNRDGWIRWRRERWPLFARDCAVTIAGVSCAGRPAPELPAVEDAGDQRAQRFCGGAVIVDSDGTAGCVLDGAGNEEGAVTGTIDVAALRQARRTHPLLNSFQAAIVYNRPDGWRHGTPPG